MTTKTHTDHQHDTDEEVSESFDAQALIDAAAAASMVPEGMSHYATDELLAALGTVERFGAVDADGTWTPYLVRPVQTDADQLAATSGRDPEHALRVAQKAWLELTADRDNVVKRIDINFSHLPNPEAPQIVVCATPASSKARRRGEIAVAVVYYPTAYTNPETGEIRASWFNAPGIAGLCATWPSYDAAEADAAELLRAVLTIRRASAQAARDDDPDAEQDARPAYQRAPKESAI